MLWLCTILVRIKSISFEIIFKWSTIFPLFTMGRSVGWDLTIRKDLSWFIWHKRELLCLRLFLVRLINWWEISNTYNYIYTLPLGLAHVCPTAFPNAAMEEWFPTENALRVPLLHHSLSAFFLVPSYLVLIQGILCIAWFFWSCQNGWGQNRIFLGASFFIN